MAATVNINSATLEQLVGLWHFTTAEAQAIMVKRPFATPNALSAALPKRISQASPPLEIPLLDLNRATGVELIRLTGIPESLANRIVLGRPYFIMLELQHVEGMTPRHFGTLLEFYAIPDFTYIDKLTGAPVALRPDSSQVLVQSTKLETEGATELSRAFSLTPLPDHYLQDDYQIFAVPESETGTDRLAQLRQSERVQKVLPSFRDQNNITRYFDPEYCIVQFQSDLSAEKQLAIIDSTGLLVAKQHRTTGLFTLRIPAAANDPATMLRAVAALNAQPGVLFAEPAYISAGDLERVDASSPGITIGSIEWNFRLIGAPEAWAYELGNRDVVIALIDTGVDLSRPAIRHILLADSSSDDWNFTDETQYEPRDYDGHGTFITGLLFGDEDSGIRGLAPHCSLMPLKVPVAGTSISYAQRRDAILYALDRIGPNQRLIINISWKTTGDVSLIRDALQTASDQGALVVCSAGNWPTQPNEAHFPSDYPFVLSVAAIDPNSRRPDYSFYGDKVSLAAPGGSGLTDPETNITSFALQSGTRSDFGTSFAAPHVAGVAALAWSQNLNRTATEVRNLLLSSAVPLLDEGMGHGRIDAAMCVSEGRSSASSTMDSDCLAETLQQINTLDLPEIVGIFHLPRITAQIIIERRPFARFEDLAGIIGVTDAFLDNWAACSNTSPVTQNGTVARPPSSPGLVNANSASIDLLLAIPGMKRISAEVIVAKRPFSSHAELMHILGLTAETASYLSVA